MAKVVYNTCFGGFGLSKAAIRLGRELSGDPQWGGDYGGRDLPRHDNVLVAVVETLGDKANGRSADLAIRELTSGTLYRIDDYDGQESVMTQADYIWTLAP